MENYLFRTIEFDKELTSLHNEVRLDLFQSKKHAHNACFFVL